MTEHDPLILAYMAGMIDADGYISISRSARDRFPKPYFAPIIGIAGTRRQPHDLAASLWGGNVNRYEPKNPRHRAQFQWCREGRAAGPIITELLPYLRVKVEQAHLALRAHALIASRTTGMDITPQLEAMRAEMVEVLNQGRQL